MARKGKAMNFWTAVGIQMLKSHLFRNFNLKEYVSYLYGIRLQVKLPLFCGLFASFSPLHVQCPSPLFTVPFSRKKFLNVQTYAFLYSVKLAKNINASRVMKNCNKSPKMPVPLKASAKFRIHVVLHSAPCVSCVPFCFNVCVHLLINCLVNTGFAWRMRASQFSRKFPALKY